jgi:DNA-binding NtrC family response regulator
MKIKKVMVVDDEAMLVDVLKDFLELKDYEVSTALNGIEALNNLESRKDIQIIFSDINMPKMDGISLMENVKKKYQNVKVVLMTGYESQIKNIDEIKKTADGFITKPFKLKKVDEVLKSLEI